MQATFKYSGIMAELGYPGMITGACEAPYDILGDYFRGTMGIFEDIIDEDVEPYVEQACNMFADMQIQRLQFMRYLDLPFKTVFFPLHKAMDGFMSDEQFARLYWPPLKKIMLSAPRCLTAKPSPRDANAKVIEPMLRLIPKSSGIS